ncbi:peptidoglycan DD-metalloendopeptidase family protein [Nautilia sp.]
MKNRYFITITTVKGTKHYTFHEIVKFIVMSVFLVVFFTIGTGYAYIEYLKEKVKGINVQKKQLSSELVKMNEQIFNLNTQIKNLNALLLNKQVALQKLNSKIEDLETKMGLKGDVYFSNINVNSLTKEEINKVLMLFPCGKPVKNIKISSRFGWRIHPILKKREFHPGVDLKGRGLIPIYATANGVVSGAGLNPYGYGYVVKISNVYGFDTLYAHLRKNIKVKAGDFVKKGQIIGYMGNTGLSTGQHLHYEIRYNDKPLNPVNFIYWNGKNFFKMFKKEKGVPWESLIKASLLITKQQ